MSPDARSDWWFTLSQMLVVLAVAAVLGWWLDRFWLFVALAALGIVGWQFWRLRKVLLRLASPRHLAEPADGRGIWNGFERQLHHRQSEARSRRQRLIDMLRAYRAVAAALPDAVVVVERNNQRIQWFNQASTALLGLYHPRDIDAALGERLLPLPISQWLASGRHAEPLLDVPSPIDPELRLSLRLIPYSDELWLLVARDISKVMRLEQMRRDFVANVSHELRTPLTVINGYLEMLDPIEQPEWAPMLGEMQLQSQRMTRLVEDLLMLSRLEAQDSLPDEHVAMAPMLNTLRREAEAVSQRGHDIHVIDAAAVDLHGSAQELHSAFSNLVNNAIRYTQIGGKITVRFERSQDGGAALSVEDSGYGIPAADLPRITERFYRVSTSRSRESGGTGLGLSIVKHVLNLHQARLDIASEVGRGSRFACHFGPERVRMRENAPTPLEST